MWKVGKTLQKVATIMQSIIWDPVNLGVAKSHIKSEILLTRPTKARLIQAYFNEATSYCLADEYRWLGKAVYSALSIPANFGGMDTLVMAASGLSHTEIGAHFSEWFAEPGWVAYESDGSNWDASMQEAHLARKCDVYDWLDSELAAHARGFIKFRGYAFKTNKGDIWHANAVKYKGRATVKSGSQDTTTGNIIIRWEQALNTLLMLDCRPYKVRGMVQGDDLLVLLWFRREMEIPRLRADLERLEALSGVHAKCGLFRDPCQTTFLSSTFVPSGAGFVFVPLPGRTFAKLFWTVQPVTKRHLDSYRGQVAEPFLRVYCGWPLMEAFLRAHIRPARPGQKPWKMHQMKDFEVTREADWAAFVSRRYGLALDCCEATMHELHAYDPTRAVILDDCFVREMIRIDLAAIEDRYTGVIGLANL